ncbi:MAG: hypothetical protein ABIK09_04790 [Pseudomonadota bacterium]
MTRRPSIVLFLVLAASLASCAEPDPGPTCLRDCDTCAGGECPKTHCGLRVVLSDTCAGRTGPLEVAVGQCVQDVTLEPGTAAHLCIALGLHDEVEVHGRSAEWVFEESVGCTVDEAGGTIVLTFDCGEEPADDVEAGDG